MESHEDLKWDRLALARELESLAQHLKEGRLKAGGRIWTVPPELTGALEVKEKKGRVVVKVKFNFGTLEEYLPAAREPVVRWQENFKSLKQRLGRLFRELQQAVRQGGLPDAATLTAFAAASREMARLAEPEWEQAMGAYLAHVEALGRAVGARDAEAVRHELDDLRTAMVTCHREFK